MSRRAMMRELRLELLQLQAEQHRLALRHELKALNLSPRPSAGQNPAWLETLTSVLGAVLPARWSRWLNVGTGLWRVVRRLRAKQSDEAAG